MAVVWTITTGTVDLNLSTGPVLTGVVQSNDTGGVYFVPNGGSVVYLSWRYINWIKPHAG